MGCHCLLCFYWTQMHHLQFEFPESFPLQMDTFPLAVYIHIVVYAQSRHWHPTPVLLSGKSHGQRSLVCCSPRGRKESDTTERLHFHFSLSCMGEGNGTPLQCSCLENPRDREAWWAAAYGVAQSRTRLKRLSSRSILERGINDYIYKL